MLQHHRSLTIQVPSLHRPTFQLGAMRENFHIVLYIPITPCFRSGCAKLSHWDCGLDTDCDCTHDHYCDCDHDCKQSKLQYFTAQLGAMKKVHKILCNPVHACLHYG